MHELFAQQKEKKPVTIKVNEKVTVDLLPGSTCKLIPVEPPKVVASEHPKETIEKPIVEKPKIIPIKQPRKAIITQEEFDEAAIPFKSNIMQGIMDRELFDNDCVLARFLRDNFYSEKPKSIKELALHVSVSPRELEETLLTCLDFYLEKKYGIVLDSSEPQSETSYEHELKKIFTVLSKEKKSS